MSVERLAALVSAVVVVIAVLAGLFLAGSPAEQRLLRLDARRVSDLRSLAATLSLYWQETETLPDDLAAVVDGRRRTSLPRDPASNEIYDYAATGPGRFELCANFDRGSPAEMADDFYAHEAGRTCFAFDLSDMRPAAIAP